MRFSKILLIARVKTNLEYSLDSTEYLSFFKKRLKLTLILFDLNKLSIFFLLFLSI